MESDPAALLHGPLFSRRAPLDRDNAASRIGAYIYGNILVLTALVPVVTSEKHLGVLIVLGTALSTFIAHSFAETVARTVREQPTTVADRIREMRNSVPILSSAVLPCALLAAGWLGWFQPRTAQILAEVAVLIRIGAIVFVIGRLRGRRPTRASAIAALLLTLAAATVVVVKIALTH
ncbi:hypothetical protein BJY24_006157 [Nocardia transvalensis]|uniref:Integral membrane protein n=1 Tax=Nocardia transvalensis TaxID=37333 RepID=A0A7W9PJS5_9NOCA|nr:hypothetical protein [Nocardia transvalensis]MBB5917245.1 hypothetical protein [Nocardia transvalensis]